ncbi:right-handed parallel beta-helix repeat-containing protein [Streptomyces sp. NPDC001508]|uniref:right-handed parallel beta-helix repeat-containing protein n=1 Tax=Streptomyces sp. NPDC001508 TaxID=3154656 RepID=UPI00332332E3
MRLKRYTTGGIMLRGTGTADSRRVIGATINAMKFTNIGGANSGFAAVHLNYARNTTIRNNTFSNLVNSGCPGCMHGVYFAEQSNNNTVSGGTFSEISGDAIRAADYSNDNKVRGGSYSRTGTKAVFSAWRLARNTKCSHGNVFYTTAKTSKSYKGATIPTVLDGADDRTKPPCTPRAVVRKNP